MNRAEAFEALESGHAIWAPEYAREVCRTLGVPFKPGLVKVYESDRHPLGITMYSGPAQGVWSLELSRSVAEALGVADQAQRLFGRGSQAREFARVVKEKLG